MRAINAVNNTIIIENYPYCIDQKHLCNSLPESFILYLVESIMRQPEKVDARLFPMKMHLEYELGLI